MMEKTLAARSGSNGFVLHEGDPDSTLAPADAGKRVPTEAPFTLNSGPILTDLASFR